MSLMALQYNINIYNVRATHFFSEHAYRHIQLCKNQLPRLLACQHYT